MALKRLDGLEKIDLIHHSDRGVQYASSEYVHLLQKNHIKISMTETGDPKENAQAERINNTMKNELLKGKRFTDIDQARAAVAKALESDGKTVSLSAVPGSPSGLRPPVNPGTR